MAAVIVPDPSLRTLGFEQRTLASGFRNQGMVFTPWVMYAQKNIFCIIVLAIDTLERFVSYQPAYTSSRVVLVQEGDKYRNQSDMIAVRRFRKDGWKTHKVEYHKHSATDTIIRHVAMCLLH
eukprot:scaffold2726_cov167-Amphora_coffeaeformis.AAC.12